MSQKTSELESILESGDRIDAQKALKDISNLPPLRLHVLRTATLEGTEPFLKLAFSLLDRKLDLEWGDLGKLSPPEPSQNKGIDAVLVYWRPEDLYPSHFLRYGQQDLKQESTDLQPILDHFDHTLDQLCSYKGGPVFIVDASLPHLGAPGHQDPSPSSPSYLVQALNLRLLETISSSPHLHLIPQQAWAATEGATHTRDLRMDLYARVPFSPAMMGRWAMMVSRSMIHLTTPRRKVIAVDADNTLWGGVLGEDGWAGVVCGQDFPGNIYLRIQERLLGLKGSGLLLILLSKNDEASIREVFEKRSDFRIQLDDFIEIRCNYESKHLNLNSSAASLGVGKDSFAFLDDSDVEREEMSTFLPEVLVLNQTPEPIAMLESLCHPELNTQQFASSDTHLQYRQRQGRIDAEKESPSRGEFLKGLGIQYSIRELDEELLSRSYQLCQKTNQFNLTTRRHSEAQLIEWMKSTDALVLLLKASDRFGDQGWVAQAIALRGDQENEWRLDTFLMSCRVLGKELELALMAELNNQLCKLGAKTLLGQYLPTPKNGPCSNFLPSLDFKTLDENQNFILHLSPEGLTCPRHLEPIQAS